jgi:hypothetical protein
MSDLRNADLSNRDVRQMSDDEKAELRRRYEHFIKHVVKAGPTSAGPVKAPSRAKPWVPTKRAGPARF